MSRWVVVSHHHHPDEGEAGVYRLTVAREIEHEVEVPDPDHEPQPGVAHPLVKRVERVHEGHRDIVWAADDERWKGMSRAEIAAAQRADVAKALEAQEREAAKRAREKRVDLGGVGEAL